METVQINFNYDSKILKDAGVDLDSAALGELKTLMLEHLAAHPQVSVRHRALVDAFTSEGEG